MPEPSSPKPPAAAIAVASVGLVVTWSSGFIGAEFASRASSEPVTVLAWRFVVVSALLVGVMLALRRSWPSRPTLIRQGTIGVLSQAVYLLAIFESVRFGVDGGTAALIAALQPLLVAAVAGRLLGEHATAWAWLGLSLGMLGVALVVSARVGEGAAPWWALLLPVAGMLSLSAGTVLQRRWADSADVLETITVQSVVAGAVFMLVAVVRGVAAPPTSPDVWFAILWLVVLSSLGGYGPYVMVARARGATFVSTLLYLAPPTTMLWLFVIFGTPVPPLALVGLAVAALGVSIVILAARGIGRR